MWLVVNYIDIDNTAEFEQFDVSPCVYKRKCWWRKFLALGTLCSYAPTALGIISYLLRNKDG